MLDVAAVGRRIHERRKAQRLTQEQLGAELGVSAQAVSRWENGDSAPDLGLLPDLCRVLGVSADALLGVSGIGLESLANDLAQRIGELDEAAADDALIEVLGRVHRGWVRNRLGGAETNLIFKWGPAGLAGLGLWRKRGLICFALGDILADEGPRPEVLERFRSLIAPGHWEIAALLLTGPKKEAALLESGIAGTEEALRRTLTEMIESTLVIQDHSGYRLNPNNGLLWAGMLKAFCTEDLLGVLMGLWSTRAR